jgi:hypothetical protein
MRRGQAWLHLPLAPRRGWIVQRQTVVLGLGGLLLVAAGWLFAEDRGAIAAASGMVFGWMVRHLTDRPTPNSVPAPLADDSAARLLALEAKTSSLRHDLRGILSPALLTAERLLGYEDPIVRRAGEIMVKTVERATARLAETKG